MFTVIFGRPGCPYCVRAKELAEKLTNERDDFNYRYVDIHAEGISKADLEKTVGKPVETVPQIFVDQKHIGGCTDFEAWAKGTMPQARTRTRRSTPTPSPARTSGGSRRTAASSPCRPAPPVSRRAKDAAPAVRERDSSPPPLAAKRRAGPAPGCRWREMPLSYVTTTISTPQ